MHMITGILFDVDGVLIDSERYIAAACIEFFKHHNIDVQKKDFEPFIGTGENRFIGGVAEKYGLKIDIEQAKIEVYRIYDDMLFGHISGIEDGLSPAPQGKNCAVNGIHDFITKAKKAGLYIAIATSADKVKLDINLKVLNLKLDDFNYAVWGNRMERNKPFPDIYLDATQGLSLRAENCLVIEDALNGVLAAKAAGCLCLGITTSFSSEQLKKTGAEFTLHDYTEFGTFSTIDEFNDRLKDLQ